MRILFVFVTAAVMCGCARVSPNANPGGQTPAETVQVKRSDKELILDAILSHITNDGRLKDTREFYGTPGDKHVALVNNSDYGVPWPAGYQPALPGWTFIQVEEDHKPDRNKSRLLGVRIDKYFDRDKERAELFRSPIAVSILNAGGGKNGGVIGGCSVYYTPKQVDGKWVVECEGWDDP